MILKSILDEFQKKDIKLDSKQVKFLNLVEVSFKRDKKMFSFLRSKKIVSIYLYGSVGIGKTLLLKSIASKLNQEYKFIHFTNFMNHIKKRLDKLDGQKNPLDKVIDELKDQKRLIFIDEFQVEDVADAMIIAEIMPKLYLNASVNHSKLDQILNPLDFSQQIYSQTQPFALLNLYQRL